MAKSTLSLGSNIGDKLRNIHHAQSLIVSRLGPVILESAEYLTEPWGDHRQNYYINKILTVETSLSPHQLLDQIHLIEKYLGRKRQEKWGPRIIDIDILFYDELIVETEELMIPHPFIPCRNFVLKPMAETMPDFVHPILQKTIKELYEECKDTAGVREMITSF